MDKWINVLVLITLGVTTCQCNNETISRTARFGELNQYFLYNRDNPREPVRLYATAASAISAATTFRTNTVVLVHDHEGSGYTSLNPIVRDALLTAEDVSIIVVDWSLVAGSTFAIASGAVPDVAAGISELLRWFIAYNRINVARLHLVGFGLGAHIVAHTARNWSGNIARITGLDPAGGDIWGANANRLTLSDARYVEIVHTDSSGYGLGEAIGHVDFFVNGGINQPGCTLEDDCNHRRAWELFAASVTHNGLEGNLCNDGAAPLAANCRGFVLAMGGNTLAKYGNGIFFFSTTNTYPYISESCVTTCT